MRDNILANIDSLDSCEKGREAIVALTVNRRYLPSHKRGIDDPDAMDIDSGQAEIRIPLWQEGSHR